MTEEEKSEYPAWLERKFVTLRSKGVNEGLFTLLTGNELKVLLVRCLFANGEGECNFQRRHIAKVTGLSPQTVYDCEERIVAKTKISPNGSWLVFNKKRKRNEDGTWAKAECKVNWAAIPDYITGLGSFKKDAEGNRVKKFDRVQILDTVKRPTEQPNEDEAALQQHPSPVQKLDTEERPPIKEETTTVSKNQTSTVSSFTSTVKLDTDTLEIIDTLNNDNDSYKKEREVTILEAKAHAQRILGELGDSEKNIGGYIWAIKSLGYQHCDEIKAEILASGKARNPAAVFMSRVKNELEERKQSRVRAEMKEMASEIGK